MQLCLGLFVFSLETLTYQELRRRTSWKHPTQPIVGARDASQFLGPGEDIITLPGSIIPEFAGVANNVDILRRMANRGHAWVLMEGTGFVYGAFVITDLDETQTYFYDDGTPRKIEFTLSLRRVDQDDDVDTTNSMGDLNAFEDISIN